MHQTPGRRHGHTRRHDGPMGLLNDKVCGYTYSERVHTNFLACAVALMLVGFGFRAIYLSAGPVSAGPTHSHVHGATSDRPVDARPAAAACGRGPRSGGQCALTALVMAAIPSMGARLTYLALFDVGSTLGMAALSGLLGWPSARVGTQRCRRAQRFAGRGMHLDRARSVLGLSARGSRLF